MTPGRWAPVGAVPGGLSTFAAKLLAAAPDPAAPLVLSPPAETGRIKVGPKRLKNG